MKIEAYFILRSDLKFDGVFVLGALHIYNENIYMCYLIERGA